MKRAIAIVPWLALALIGWGCHQPVPPQVLQQWQGHSLYTCCNMHYESKEVNDGNYDVGAMLPFGSPATVENMTSDSVTIRSGATDLSIYHRYGRDQESSQAYFGKILVDTDPHARFDTYPPKIREAIKDGRVEKGMTKEQVI